MYPPLPKVPDVPTLKYSPRILSIRSACGALSFASQVGVDEVSSIKVVQENGGCGSETEDVWLVISDEVGEVYRVLAAHAIIYYRDPTSKT